MRNNFAILDMKCGEISAISVRTEKNGTLVIDSFVRESSGGVHKGVVTDVNMAADSIGGVLLKLKEKTRKKISNVYLSVSSSTIGLIPSEATLLLSKYGKEISKSDIDKCIRMGSIVKLDVGKEVLHCLVKEYSVDGTTGIKNPLGLEGVKLGVEMNVITIDSSLMRNIEKCVSLAGYALSGIIFSGLAYAYRALNEDEMENGAAFINLDKDLSEALVFNGKMMQSCSVMHIGSADTVDKRISHDDINNLIAVIGSLDGSKSVRNIVVTGDSDMSEAVIEGLEQLLSYPVRFGACIAKPSEELPLDRMGYIGCLGMLDYIKEENAKKALGGSFFAQIASKIVSFADEYF